MPRRPNALSMTGPKRFYTAVMGLIRRRSVRKRGGGSESPGSDASSSGSTESPPPATVRRERQQMGKGVQENSTGQNVPAEKYREQDDVNSRGRRGTSRSFGSPSALARVNGGPREGAPGGSYRNGTIYYDDNLSPDEIPSEGGVGEGSLYIDGSQPQRREPQQSLRNGYHSLFNQRLPTIVRKPFGGTCVNATRNDTTTSLYKAPPSDLSMYCPQSESAYETENVGIYGGVEGSFFFPSSGAPQTEEDVREAQLVLPPLHGQSASGIYSTLNGPPDTSAVSSNGCSLMRSRADVSGAQIHSVGYSNPYSSIFDIQCFNRNLGAYDDSDSDDTQSSGSDSDSSQGNYTIGQQQNEGRSIISQYNTSYTEFPLKGENMRPDDAFLFSEWLEHSQLSHRAPMQGRQYNGKEPLTSAHDDQDRGGMRFGTGGVTQGSACYFLPEWESVPQTHNVTMRADPRTFKRVDSPTWSLLYKLDVTERGETNGKSVAPERGAVSSIPLFP
ncbi:hypothetical protein DQ04_06501020 [Trypanosoma grayi]|uniref:hypothetical protein n=1 Tax=Trypanosoma grayi TaxID=71804 RepID=UPI0004F42C68|nr:hypothetical protein DQ04_06501020 [Trypanosoma grayi]KEG08756.1 hypothetical protein DQ04_06501020 [Trypanosoma grayi]